MQPPCVVDCPRPSGGSDGVLRRAIMPRRRQPAGCSPRLQPVAADVAAEAQRSRCPPSSSPVEVRKQSVQCVREARPLHSVSCRTLLFLWTAGPALDLDEDVAVRARARRRQRAVDLVVLPGTPGVLLSSPTVTLPAVVPKYPFRVSFSSHSFDDDLLDAGVEEDGVAARPPQTARDRAPVSARRASAKLGHAWRRRPAPTGTLRWSGLSFMYLFAPMRRSAK